MSIFKFIFPSQSSVSTEPPIMFGRFTDTFKPPVKYDEWDKAIRFYEKQRYRESLLCFLEYLKSDELDNVQYQQIEDNISFDFLQGSKKIVGILTDTGIFVEAKIAKTSSLHIGFLRKLIEDNYLLKYSRYALDDENNITIIFNTFLEDASPYKLYYALKELATHADRIDDVLIDEFEDLDYINTGHLRLIPEDEKAIKYQFLQSEVLKVFELINSQTLDPYNYPGAISFTLLALNYQLDYLIKPEGFIMEKLESIHNIFFKAKEKEAFKRNNLMIKELELIIGRSEKEFNTELYETVSSFGVTTPISQRQLAEFINAELPNMDWYRDNGHLEYAIAIPHYIVGYVLFNYGLSLPMSRLFKLYYRVLHDDFFQKLGFESLRVESGRLDATKIKRTIRQILKENEVIYPHAKPKLKIINFDSLIDFASSFLKMISQLNLDRSDHKEVN